MPESFLSYLWQLQYFDKQQLLTTAGEPLHIFNQGMLNTHAGPDFSNARIRIGSIEWVGSVEIHDRASAWHEHKHDQDAAYNNVVLHVVWSNDKSVRRSDGSELPTIELKDRVNEQLLLQYKKLVNSPEVIPCSGIFRHVSDLTRMSMLDRTLAQRLEAKADVVHTMLAQNNHDWEETCYQLLAKNFGFKINADPFLQLARAVPYKSLLKHADKSLQLEALLFGQAGFLDDAHTDDYYLALKREYALLSHKYQLRERKLHKAQWRFLRLRPANFPTLRIAQFSAILFCQKNIFSAIVEADSYAALNTLFSVTQSPYWQSHYQFSTPAEQSIPALGSMSIDNIIINTVAPLLVAYGKLKDEQRWIDRAVAILQEVAAEDNSITKKWSSLGQPVKTAFDSQALIELYNNLCIKKRCLSCVIGSSILKPHYA